MEQDVVVGEGAAVRERAFPAPPVRTMPRRSTTGHDQPNTSRWSGARSHSATMLST